MGANLGDRTQTLVEAVCALEATPGIHVTATSHVYETSPVGGEHQPDYLNAVVRAHTSLSAQDLLTSLLRVERRFGRVRGRKWAARTLDLDLLLYGSEIIQEDGLRVPHPRLHDRGFVLAPLCDLCPNASHPELGKTFRILADAVCPGHFVQRVEGLSLAPACR